jgi:glucose/arabinose dehydrogenase
MRPWITAGMGATALLLSGCGGTSLPVEAGYGPNPQLPAPRKGLLPTVNIAPAKGWPEGGKPTAAPGFEVNAFARGLNHPRRPYTLPNGDILVAESNAPPKPGDKGVRAWIMKKVMAAAGAGVPSPNRIILLRDVNGDGTAEVRSTFLSGLNSPFGMVLVGDALFIANADAVVRVPYQTGQTQISATPVKVTDLPGGPINHHWTKDITASPDGSRLYVTVGSNSNVGERGMDAEVDRAAVLEVNPATGARRLFASGLRNPNGATFHPESGQLWVAVNERDEIGDDLVPDYMTSVREGGFYGWPYSYYGQHVDVRVKPQRPDLVQKAIVPDYALGAHTASLGLAFYTGQLLPQAYRGGAFVGQHGSWNRAKPSGYKVVFVPFTAGRTSGRPQDVLTGFLDGRNNALGRPVGVTVARDGAVLVADDVGNAIWRITPGG